MKVLTSFVLMLIPLASADAYESHIPISTHIVKNVNSTKIAIESDQNVYTAVYRDDDEKFDDVNMPFRVISPVSVTQLYDLTLSDSYSECDGQEIQVISEVDNLVMNRGDRIRGLDFVNSDASNKWSEHRLKLSYPVIQKNTVSQQCLGNVMITVELDI